MGRPYEWPGPTYTVTLYAPDRSPAERAAHSDHRQIIDAQEEKP